ncbi:MAG TPA: NUDIX domain-containing protein [Ilumatobacteraceae bacterium]
MPSRHPEVCVGAVVVHRGELLLVQRGRGAGQGSWSVPGGRVEWGETLEAAVRRELHEETGLQALDVAPLGVVERIDETWHFVIHDFVVTVDSTDGACAGDDAAALAWVPLAEVGTRSGMVPGLVEFLADHGILGGDGRVGGDEISGGQ